MATTEAAADDPAAAPARSRLITAAAAGLAVALLIGLGVLLGLLAPTLTRPGDDSPEAGFARDMIAHHAQAVQLGMIAHARAAHPDVRAVGADIALTQQGQVGMMHAWLREWRLDPNGSRPPMAWMPDGAAAVRDGLMPGMATPAEIQQLDTATGRQVDVLFLQLMQKHHLGGIHMAEEVVKRTDDREVLDAARTAINGQQREITDMRRLLTEVQQTP